MSDDEITLPADTVRALMRRPWLIVGMLRASRQDTPTLTAWLDGHGLRWRPGGSDPIAAFTDAAAADALIFEALPPDTERARAQRARRLRTRRQRR